jgi:hypothetical protein
MNTIEVLTAVGFSFFAGMLAGFLLCLYRLPELATMIQNIVVP